jgi:hypothetical protein
MAVKQKSQSSAAFLGVLHVSKNVVGKCCIPTTALTLSVSAGRHLELRKTGVKRHAVSPGRFNHSGQKIRTRQVRKATSGKRPQRWTLRPFERSCVTGDVPD